MMVLAFIIILMLGFARESKADDVVSAEFGPTVLSGQFSDSAALIVNYQWNDRWLVGMGLTGPQKVIPRKEPETDVRTNLMVHGQRRVHLSDRWALGLGVAYWNAKTRWNGSNMTASMSIEFELNDKWDIKFRHFSNAGSASPNMGQDMLVIGYTF